MNKQAGFTLIELIMVIVILGILAATALPKFVDLAGEAEQAAVKGVAGAISSAGTINYATAKMRPASAAAITDSANACAGGTNSVFAGQGTLLQSGITLVTGTPLTTDQYTIVAGGACVAGASTTVSCTITSNTGKQAIASVPCTN